MKRRIRQSGRYVNVAKYRAYNSSVPFAERPAWQNAREAMLPRSGRSC